MRACWGAGAMQVIAAQDIGLYAGLCALASYDRKDLRNLVRVDTAHQTGPDIQSSRTPPGSLLP